MEVNDICLTSNLTSAEKLPFEIVERKGIGHPDTLADGVAEAISLKYSNYCMQKFGVILHQTLDKIMFIGGLGKFGFGIGEMIRPWRLILNGRLTENFGKEAIPCKEIAFNAVKNYLRKTVPKLDLNKWLKIEYYTNSFSKNPYWFKPRDLNDIPDAYKPYANDTSTCVGYWPLSPIEKLALLMEAYFYDKNGVARFSFIGQDIKVMCVRKYKSVEITMCIPFFSKEIPNYEVYIEKKELIKSDLYKLAKDFLKNKYRINFNINTQDEMIKGTKGSIGHFFVISGSALDSGEEGVVGRGNRSRGVISTIRPTCLEAIQGKNPVYYVGKVYSYLADLLAKKISQTFICEAQVFLSSKNSDPLVKPRNVFVKTTKNVNKAQVLNIINTELEKKSWAKEIIKKRSFLPFPGGGNGYKSNLSECLKNL